MNTSKRSIAAVCSLVVAIAAATLSNAASATVIPVAGGATASSYYNPSYSLDPTKTIDGSGLAGTYPNQTHSTDYLDMWLSDTGDVVDAWIQWDLGDVYTLDGAQVWNYNQYTVHPSGNDWSWRGIQYADIYTSTDGVSWTLLGADTLFPQATASADYTGFYLDFGGVDAQYVKFVVDSNWISSAAGDQYDGIGNYVGLSEIQFHSSVPEPSTLVLLGIALLGLGLFRRGKAT